MSITTKLQRDAIREAVQHARPNELRQAVYSVLHHTARAVADETDKPEDKTLGWFADGMETAVVLVWQNLKKGQPLPGEDDNDVDDDPATDAGRHEQADHAGGAGGVPARAVLGDPGAVPGA